MLINQTENRNYSYYFYSHANVSDQKSLLNTFFDFSQNDAFTLEYIRLEDGRSYHDGTETTILQSNFDKKEFLNICDNSDFVSVSFFAKLDGKPVAVVALLDTLQFKIVIMKSDEADLKRIEEILGLTE